MLTNDLRGDQRATGKEEKLTDVVALKPNVMGVGLDLNPLLERWNLNDLLTWIQGVLRR